MYGRVLMQGTSAMHKYVPLGVLHQQLSTMYKDLWMEEKGDMQSNWGSKRTQLYFENMA